MTIAAIITAAGTSSRFGSGTKKEFCTLNDKPVLYYAALPFVQDPRISRIVVTYPAEQLKPMQDCLKDLDTTQIEYCEGGENRRISVFNALKCLEKGISPDYVLIHDGARPFLTNELLGKCIQVTVESGACVPALTITDALKKTSNGMITEHLNRNEYCTVQTPQGFRYLPLLEKHKNACNNPKEYHDDTEIYGMDSSAITIIPGDPANIKITFRGDLEKHK